jgi:hypothetical protein
MGKAQARVSFMAEEHVLKGGKINFKKELGWGSFRELHLAHMQAIATKPLIAGENPI